MKYYKAVILEILDDRLIVLTTEGNIISVHKKGNVSVGQKIYVLEEDIFFEKKTKKFRKTAVICGVLATAAVFGLVINTWFYNNKKDDEKECTSVLIQGGYSIEFQMDESDNIIDINIEGNYDKEENYDYWIGKKFKDILPEVYDEVSESKNESKDISYEIKSNNDKEVYENEIQSVITSKQTGSTQEPKETQNGVKETTQQPSTTAKTTINSSATASQAPKTTHSSQNSSNSVAPSQKSSVDNNYTQEKEEVSVSPSATTRVQRNYTKRPYNGSYYHNSYNVWKDNTTLNKETASPKPTNVVTSDEGDNN